MATDHSNDIAASHPKLSKQMYWWGEIYEGTQDDLQSLGLGQGMTFPATRRTTLRLTDPRGLPCEVWRNYGNDGSFSAKVTYPDRIRSEGEPFDYAPGVTKQEASNHDLYVGTAESLAAAGLVELQKLPGAPGMPKTGVHLGADGAVIASRSARALEHSTLVLKVSKHRFHVASHTLPKHVIAKRQAAEDAWKQRWANAPRPQSLDWKNEQAQLARSLDRFQVKRIKALPATKAIYRDQLAGQFELLTRVVINQMSPEHGYRYCTEDIEDFKRAASDLYWRLRQGAIEGESPDQALQAVLLSRAKSDHHLQTFLQGLPATGTAES